METLPEEIVEKIVDRIFQENPRDLYRSRLVSKTWKSIIDECTSRLFKLWCKQCLDKIPENDLDDIVYTTCSRFASWKEYCSNEFALPHIAREISVSFNKFSNLTHSRVSVTEGCLVPQTRGYRKIHHYALNDEYIAVHFREPVESKSVVRIYAINDVNHCIREYSIPLLCQKIVFYATDKQYFIIIQVHDDNNRGKTFFYLAKFLVNDYLAPWNLPVTADMKLVITKNQCFIVYSCLKDPLEHYRMTPDGFEKNAIIKLPLYNGRTDLSNIQICHSSLFVSARLSKYSPLHEKNREMAVYKYRITQQPNDKLLFADPEIYQRTSIFFNRRLTDSIPFWLSTTFYFDTDLEINFGTENVSLQNSICDLYPAELKYWLLNYFNMDNMQLITIYTYHVLILSNDKIIVFQGTLRQLMDYAVKNADPGSKCTEIDLRSVEELRYLCRIYPGILDENSKLKFLVIARDKTFIIDLSP